jgi:hypothetical protein
MLPEPAGSRKPQNWEKGQNYHVSSILPPFFPLLPPQSTKKDILSVPQILSHIPLFGVWSTKNRYSASVDSGSLCVHWIERSKWT